MSTRSESAAAAAASSKAMLKTASTILAPSMLTPPPPATEAIVAQPTTASLSYADVERWFFSHYYDPVARDLVLLDSTDVALKATRLMRVALNHYLNLSQLCSEYEQATLQKKDVHCAKWFERELKRSFIDVIAFAVVIDDRNGTTTATTAARTRASSAWSSLSDAEVLSGSAGVGFPERDVQNNTPYHTCSASATVSATLGSSRAKTRKTTRSTILRQQQLQQQKHQQQQQAQEGQALPAQDDTASSGSVWGYPFSAPSFHFYHRSHADSTCISNNNSHSTGARENQPAFISDESAVAASTTAMACFLGIRGPNSDDFSLTKAGKKASRSARKRTSSNAFDVNESDAGKSKAYSSPLTAFATADTNVSNLQVCAPHPPAAIAAAMKLEERGIVGKTEGEGRRELGEPAGEEGTEGDASSVASFGLISSRFFAPLSTSSSSFSSSQISTKGTTNNDHSNNSSDIIITPEDFLPLPLPAPLPVPLRIARMPAAANYSEDFFHNDDDIINNSSIDSVEKSTDEDYDNSNDVGIVNNDHNTNSPTAHSAGNVSKREPHLLQRRRRSKKNGYGGNTERAPKGCRFIFAPTTLIGRDSGSVVAVAGREVGQGVGPCSARIEVKPMPVTNRYRAGGGKGGTGARFPSSSSSNEGCLPSELASILPYSSKALAKAATDAAVAVAKAAAAKAKAKAKEKRSKAFPAASAGTQEGEREGKGERKERKNAGRVRDGVKGGEDMLSEIFRKNPPPEATLAPLPFPTFPPSLPAAAPAAAPDATPSVALPSPSRSLSPGVDCASEDKACATAPAVSDDSAASVVTHTLMPATGPNAPNAPIAPTSIAPAALTLISISHSTTSTTADPEPSWSAAKTTTETIGATETTTAGTLPSAAATAPIFSTYPAAEVGFDQTTTTAAAASADKTATTAVANARPTNSKKKDTKIGKESKQEQHLQKNLEEEEEAKLLEKEDRRFDHFDSPIVQKHLGLEEEMQMLSELDFWACSISRLPCKFSFPPWSDTEIFELKRNVRKAQRVLIVLGDDDFFYDLLLQQNFVVLATRLRIMHNLELLAKDTDIPPVPRMDWSEKYVPPPPELPVNLSRVIMQANRPTINWSLIARIMRRARDDCQVMWKQCAQPHILHKAHFSEQEDAFAVEFRHRWDSAGKGIGLWDALEPLLQRSADSIQRRHEGVMATRRNALVWAEYEKLGMKRGTEGALRVAAYGRKAGTVVNVLGKGEGVLVPEMGRGGAGAGTGSGTGADVAAVVRGVLLEGRGDGGGDRMHGAIGSSVGLRKAVHSLTLRGLPAADLMGKSSGVSNSGEHISSKDADRCANLGLAAATSRPLAVRTAADGAQLVEAAKSVETKDPQQKIEVIAHVKSSHIQSGQEKIVEVTSKADRGALMSVNSGSATGSEIGLESEDRE